MRRTDGEAALSGYGARQARRTRQGRKGAPNPTYRLPLKNGANPLIKKILLILRNPVNSVLFFPIAFPARPSNRAALSEPIWSEPR